MTRDNGDRFYHPHRSIGGLTFPPHVPSQPIDSEVCSMLVRASHARASEEKRAQMKVRIDRLNDFPLLCMLHAASSLERGVEVLQPNSRRCLPAIAPPSTTCTYALYLISGEITYGSAHRPAIAGDLLVTTEVANIASALSSNVKALLLILRGCELQHIGDNQSPIIAHICRHELLAPLAGCLSFLSSRFSSASKDEYERLHAAVRALLPVAIGRSNRQISPVAGSVALKLQEFVDRELHDLDLNASKVASHFGISIRYVHKLFAQRGLTVGSYIKARRLEQVRLDLAAPTSRERSIAAVAKRWGFANPSTFARAFKVKYGYKPSEAKFT